MDINNIPNHIKQILNDRSLTMNQKLVAFTCFMPKLPDIDNETINKLNENIELGKTIKQLIQDNKIEINGFKSDFKLNITTK